MVPCCSQNKVQTPQFGGKNAPHAANNSVYSALKFSISTEQKQGIQLKMETIREKDFQVFWIKAAKYKLTWNRVRITWLNSYFRKHLP